MQLLLCTSLIILFFFVWSQSKAEFAERDIKVSFLMVFGLELMVWIASSLQLSYAILVTFWEEWISELVVAADTTFDAGMAAIFFPISYG